MDEKIKTLLYRSFDEDLSPAQTKNFQELSEEVKVIDRSALILDIFQKHAKDVWPLFSDAIKNAAPLEEYRLIQLLGSGSSFNKKKPSVLSDLPDELLTEWCLQNPDQSLRGSQLSYLL